jgi:preprotein translocase subunit SecG
MMISLIQIVLGVTLVTAILLQSKGAGLSGIFGGEGNVYRTKRGAEKTLFLFTIVNSILFFSIALLNVIFGGKL